MLSFWCKIRQETLWEQIHTLVDKRLSEAAAANAATSNDRQVIPFHFWRGS
jgi:hypothetical protein